MRVGIQWLNMFSDIILYKRKMSEIEKEKKFTVKISSINKKGLKENGNDVTVTMSVNAE